MTALRPLRLLLCVLALAGFATDARAQGLETAADLGPAAASGTDASNSIKSRAQKLHTAMACGNEFDFVQGYSLAHRYGNGGNAPNPALAAWPVTLMVGKAARLIDQSRDRIPCEALMDRSNGGSWVFLTATQAQVLGETAAGAINRAYHDLFSIDGATDGPCENVAQLVDPDKVKLTLSDACLAREIRVVMTDPRHGPWNEKGGVVTPEFPGTSAGKLTCLSEFKFNVSGVDGDWDQAVIEYTRLTALLYRYGNSSQPAGVDIQIAIDELNRRFLTLRSSPEQGATARESFNLVTSCGNLPNQSGSASDTVNGITPNPGTNTYEQAANDAAGHNSFLRSLFRFLAALLVLLGIGAVAYAVGALVGAVLGAIAGAAVFGAVVAVVAVVVFIAFAAGGIEETENHLLMQNTSRYIKNKLMMAELSRQGDRNGFNTIESLNEELRGWLLDHMQTITQDDFVEYNAKPYNRLSHASILNLIDYACDVSWDYDKSPYILNSDNPCDVKDRAIVDAASAVMDLSAAKTAVGSFEGRRFVPYRRLAEQNYQFYNGRSMLELTNGADNQLAALQIWTGQMRHAPFSVAFEGTFGDLEWFSTSKYRPDPLILDIAVNKTIPREQQYRHHTRERYASGNGWLITAGGTDEGPAQGFKTGVGITIYPPINGDVKNDRGVGVPTTLMTSAQIADANGNMVGRAKVQQFLRFEGNKKDFGTLDGTKPLWSFSDNNCVAGSFACGLALRLPSDYDVNTCRVSQLTEHFSVVDSTKCAAFKDGDMDPSNDIFIAILQNPNGWGFFEVAQQDAFSRSGPAFSNAIALHNQGRIASWESAGPGDTVEYFSVTQNRLIKFTPKDEDFSADRRACGVVNHESGARLTISNVPAAQQAACLSVGPRIFIDLNDAKNLIRRGEGGLALEQFWN